MNDWLEKFKGSWINKDLQGVMSLFSDNVVYFETPFLKLNSKKKILDEWQAIMNQENIDFRYSVFSETDSRGTVIWDLSYKRNGEQFNYKGTYLIELDNQGLCKYFHQTCEGQE